MSAAESRPRQQDWLKDLGPSIYLPGVLSSICQGGLIVLLPLYLLDQGYSPALAALVVGMRGIGMFAADLPAGRLIAQYGDRRTILIGAAMLAVSFFLIGLTNHIWLIGLAGFLGGMGSTCGLLGRQTYIAAAYDREYRGRAIGALGGCMRIGNLLGPLVGGVLAAQLGYVIVFYIAGFICLIAWLIILVFLRSEHCKQGSQHSFRHALETVQANRTIFFTVGGSMLGLQLMRAARATLLPICGALAGLDVQAVGFLVSMGATLDAILFYPTGLIMDRLGRQWSAFPSLGLFALGLVILVFADSWPELITAAVVLGFANGLSAGLLLVIGSDYAPDAARGQFLAVWKFFCDTGSAGAPLVISTLLKFTGLIASGVVVAVTGLVGLVLFARYYRDTMDHSRTAPPGRPQ